MPVKKKVRFVLIIGLCRKFSGADDALAEFAGELGVQALPAFRFYKDGKEALETISGYKKRPLAEAVERLAGN